MAFTTLASDVREVPVFSYDHIFEHDLQLDRATRAALPKDYFLDPRDLQGNCKKIIRVYDAIKKDLPAFSPKFYLDKHVFEALGNAQDNQVEGWAFIAGYITLFVAAIFTQIAPPVALTLLILAPIVWTLGFIYQCIKKQAQGDVPVRDRQPNLTVDEVLSRTATHWVLQYEKAKGKHKQKIVNEARMLVSKSSKDQHLEHIYAAAQAIITSDDASSGDPERVRLAMEDLRLLIDMP